MPSHVGDVQSSLLHVPPGMINDAAEEDVAYLHVNCWTVWDFPGGHHRHVLKVRMMVSCLGDMTCRILQVSIELIFKYV